MNLLHSANRTRYPGQTLQWIYEHRQYPWTWKHRVNTPILILIIFDTSEGSVLEKDQFYRKMVNWLTELPTWNNIKLIKLQSTVQRASYFKEHFAKLMSWVTSKINEILNNFFFQMKFELKEAGSYQHLYLQENFCSRDCQRVIVKTTSRQSKWGGPLPDGH